MWRFHRTSVRPVLPTVAAADGEFETDGDKKTVEEHAVSRKRNKARPEKWLAEKKKETVTDNSSQVMDQDKSIMENNEDSEVVNKPVEASAATDSTNKDLKVLLDGQYTKVVKTIKDSGVNIQKLGVIEQVDGQIESSTITFDLTLSAFMSFDAYISIEENLCHG